MSSNKDVILAQREGFVAGMRAGSHGQLNFKVCWAEAERLFPIPKITRPRTIDGLLGCRNTNRSYRFVDGVFMYSDTGDGRWHKSQWTPADIARLHDLMINPTEEVEDTE